MSDLFVTYTSVNVGRDFSKHPGGRYRDDGPHSGQRLREDFLVPALKEGVEVVHVFLDGAIGSPSASWRRPLVGSYGVTASSSRNSRKSSTSSRATASGKPKFGSPSGKQLTGLTRPSKLSRVFL